MTAAITACRPAGRNAELDGACGYAVELLELLGDSEAALVIVGSILHGELRGLRDMPAPPSRTPPDVRVMRERLAWDGPELVDTAGPRDDPAGQPAP